MMSERDHTKSSHDWLRILLTLPFGDWAPIIAQLLKHISLPLARPGIYEVLDHDVRLELKDAHGHEALYTKRQKVKFLQNNIIAYEDKAWGDGEIFADYRCSPGRAVDRYREGHRYRILISLRERKQAGDVEEFHIQRTIRNGFVHKVEDLQTEVDHRMQQLTLSVVFPLRRPPREATLIEQNSTRSYDLMGEHVRKLPDGRVQVSWHVNKPRLYEAYILRWVW